MRYSYPQKILNWIKLRWIIFVPLLVCSLIIFRLFLPFLRCDYCKYIVKLIDKDSTNKTIIQIQQSLFRKQQLQDLHDHAYVAVCLIAREEHKFINEWVKYHQFIGIEKFYIYDHLSDPPMHELLKEEISSNLVDYRYVSQDWELDPYKLTRDVDYWFNGVNQNFNSPQRWAHIDCFLQNRKKHTFMAMFDVDEFIVLNQGKHNNYTPVVDPHLPTFLKQFENDGGLFVYWRLFGSSGLQTSPESGVLENYLNCEQQPNKSWNDVKHIVNTKFMGEAFCVIHGCETTKPSVNVLHQEKQLRGNLKEDPTWEGINLNHYMIKSKEDYENKRKRGGGHSPVKTYQTWRDQVFYDGVDNKATGDCSFMKNVYRQCCNDTHTYSQA